jgi:hypothetical protein
MTAGVAARLLPLSLFLFVASIAVYLAVAWQTLATAPIPFLLTVLTVVLVLAVHEALHGIGFLLFGGRPKFGAGIKGGAPYLFAMCPGRRFTWGRFLVIGALPLVVIDASALALAGYTPLVVPAMLAFAFNTAAAVGDLWMIAVILQTARTATFEAHDEPAMIAWPGPGTKRPERLPRGLDPHGFESFVKWAGLAAVLFMAAFLVIGIVEVSLARASANHTLAIGNVVLASMTKTTVRVNLLPETVLAAVLATLITWAAMRLSRRSRRN